MSKTLIVVDMLNDFCHPDGSLATSLVTGKIYALPIIPEVKAIIDKYRNSVDDSIIWLTDSHSEDDLEFKKFPKHAVKGTWGAAVIKELEPVLGLRIEKTRYSGFYGTGLDDLLSNELQSDRIEVIGVCTSICVMDTVGGLANRDYKVTVHKYAVADFDPAAHEFALKRMATLYGAYIDKTFKFIG